MHRRLTTLLYMLLVFAAGVLIGVTSHRLYDTNTASASTANGPQNMTEFRKRYLAEMRDRVHVNDKQIAAVVQHLDDAKRRFDDLRAQEQPLHDRIQQELVDEIRGELSEDQRPAYDKWHTERLAEQAKAQSDAQSQPQRK
jgi:hypothetical protein